MIKSFASIAARVFFFFGIFCVGLFGTSPLFYYADMWRHYWTQPQIQPATLCESR
jgi:hypothetical protein